jgi:protein TonB
MKKNLIVDLKERFPLYFRSSVLLAIITFICGFYLFPRYSLHPYVPRVDQITKVEVQPDEIDKVEELPPEVKPQLPVEAESEEEIQQATIEKTADFETFEKLPIQPEAETPEFVAYDTPPRPKSIVKPKYPEIAKQAGIEGTVILQLLVDVDGRVLKAKILKSLAKDLDESAIQAAYATTFYPAKQRDKPVKVWVSYPVRFILEE